MCHTSKIKIHQKRRNSSEVSRKTMKKIDRKNDFLDALVGM